MGGLVHAKPLWEPLNLSYFNSWLGKVCFFVFVFVCLCVFGFIKQMQATLDNTLLMSLF